MKRILSFALTLVLVFSLILPMTAADHSTCAHCSHDGSALHIGIKENTVIISGTLNYDNLEAVWLRCGDTSIIDLPYSKVVSVDSGEYFTVNLDISSLKGESAIRILYRRSGENSYYAHHDHVVYKAVPTSSGWKLVTDPLIDDGKTNSLESIIDMFNANAAATNKDVSVSSTVNSITSSTDEENFVKVTINGNTATVSGILQFEGLGSIWCRCSDTRTVGRPDSKVIGVSSGEHFSVDLDLSDVKEETFIDIRAALEGDSAYVSVFPEHFRVKPENGSWVLRTAPAASHNMTIQNMWINLADTFDVKISDTVRKQSNEICKGITDNYHKLWALHKWVAENIYYDMDWLISGKVGVHDPDSVLKKKASVCQGYSKLLEAMIEAQGIPAIITYTYSSGLNNGGATFWNIDEYPTDTNHAHVAAFVNKRWVLMDPTWDSKNIYVNGKYETHSPTAYEYFDPTPENFAYDHIIVTRANEQDISDIPASWAAPEVLEAMTENLVPAFLQKDYALNITRAEFSKLIVQLLREKNAKIPSSSSITFSDTNDPDVLAAAAAGIVLGSNGKFNPNNYITRQEAATMLSRAANVLGIKAGTPVSFGDIDKAAGWAVDYINNVSSMITTDGRRVMGGSGNSFDPLGSYTRQQAILTVVRLANCK